MSRLPSRPHDQRQTIARSSFFSGRQRHFMTDRAQIQLVLAKNSRPSSSRRSAVPQHAKPIAISPAPPFGPVQARRTPRSTAHHARFYHYQRPVLLTSTPTHQSKPIGHTLRSGLVQNIFSSLARLAYVSALLTPTVATPPS